MQLTEHFSFDELTTTGVAGMLALNHVHANKFLKQLKYTAEALEECRAIIGEGLTVSSGYRTPELNKVVGGSVTSKHTQGLCADFKPVTMSVKKHLKNSLLIKVSYTLFVRLLSKVCAGKSGYTYKRKQ